MRSLRLACPTGARCALVTLSVTLLSVPISTIASAAVEASDLRLTPVVRAVQAARPSVVNIQGQKTVQGDQASGGIASVPREVNGMGTGVVIDPRGYILTNHHVVAGVHRINVTLDGGQKLVAHLVAHDERTDLAVIKVRGSSSMGVISIGSSADLMTGEPVVALGNAYGYEHTVTRGIISALHRNVQVTDTQSYEDLIQTDASINPGNSGGPLLNIKGEMIGLNVAVRAGAQGIGFAIPVDTAIAVAAKLMSVERLERRWHGLITEAPQRPGDPLVVRRVEPASPADECGFEAGDSITAVAKIPIERPLDLERTLLGRRTGEPVPVEVLRGQRRISLDLRLAALPVTATPHDIAATSRGGAPRDERIWEILGLDLAEEPRTTFSQRGSRYNGGMRVVAVRSDGPAARQGIIPSDILVGMHGWETASEQDIDYIVRRANMGGLGTVKFYVLRGADTLYGHMNVANAAARRASARR